MAITTRGIVSGLPSGGGGEGGGPVSWADILSKPTSFPTTWTAIADKPEVVTADMLAPVALSGSVDDIADLPFPLSAGTPGQVLTSDAEGAIVWSDAPAGAAPTWEDVTGKPEFGAFATLGTGSAGQTIVADDIMGYPQWADAGTGMLALEDDEAPTLGGPLTMAGQNLVGNFNVAKADGTAILQVIPGYYEGELSLLHQGAAGERLDIASYSGDIRITSTTGDVVIQGLAYPGADGADGDVLSTDGEGNLSWTTPAGAEPVEGFTTYAVTVTDATPTELFRVTLPTYTARVIDATILGDTESGDIWAMKVFRCYRSGGDAAVVVGAGSSTVTYSDGATHAVEFTTSGLDVIVTGTAPAAMTTHWRATVRTT